MKSFELILFVIFFVFVTVIPVFLKLVMRFSDKFMQLHQKTVNQQDNEFKRYMDNLVTEVSNKEVLQEWNKNQEKEKIVIDTTPTLEPFIPEEPVVHTGVQVMKTEEKVNPWKGKVFRKEIARGLIMAEVLGKPRALKPFKF